MSFAANGSKTKLLMTQFTVRPDGTTQLQPGVRFEAMINPAEFKYSSGISYDKQKTLGEASAISTVADATALAIEWIAASIRQPGGIEAVNLKVAERYVDAFAGLAKTNNTMIVPANLSDLATLIASAAQIVKAQTTTVQGPRVG